MRTTLGTRIVISLLNSYQKPGHWYLLNKLQMKSRYLLLISLPYRITGAFSKYGLKK